MSKNNKKKRHHKKHRVVSPYFTTPIIYLLISLLVVVPMLVVGMNFAIKVVHTAQEGLKVDYNDIQISQYADGNLSACDYLGTIQCAQIGLKADMYYGINRVSMRYGCGVEYDDNGAMNIVGYSSSAFKMLPNIGMDNVITIADSEGETMYRVCDISSNPSKDTDDKTIVLCTTKSNEAFSYFAKQNMYVTAKEVQYE